MENVITLDKLIGLLILFCHPLLSILFLKTPNIRGMTSLSLKWEQFFKLASEQSERDAIYSCLWNLEIYIYLYVFCE